ncbi:hypothetical protein BAUCODRAFT_37119 [Baudoinia panamericana UAMH 10762]|uniref:Uncharacterized protein n=1 Tax=Baudoinia panamericana (strain UAMH 10762) TaxID=717646 RepID=M2MAE8_BAUPA|nr:uncharacterized protein BAUCODRAFT_37119 [Baudoinia panamericana UAMH 10762]EMC93446.1 hypothetical protein BAUCODRAFT_37119 [Baudoinia panamericana UAMH 10762]
MPLSLGMTLKPSFCKPQRQSFNIECVEHEVSQMSLVSHTGLRWFSVYCPEATLFCGFDELLDGEMGPDST